MPCLLLLVVGGLALVFATSYVTLGWILFTIGVVLFVGSLLLLLLGGLFFNKKRKQFNREFDNFGNFPRF